MSAISARTRSLASLRVAWIVVSSGPEIEVLVGRKMLVREDQHGILVERLFDVGALFVRQRKRKIDVADLGREGFINGEHNHGRPPALKTFNL